MQVSRVQSIVQCVKICTEGSFLSQSPWIYKSLFKMSLIMSRKNDDSPFMSCTLKNVLFRIDLNPLWAFGLHWLAAVSCSARSECWKSDYGTAEIWQCHVFLLNKGSRRIVFLTLARSPEQRDKLIGLESLLSLNYTT